MLPWGLVILAVIFSSVGIFIYAGINPEDNQKLHDVINVGLKLKPVKIPKSSGNTIIALTTAEQAENEDKELKLFYNKDYYDLLERGENYRSLFEDLYLNHLRIDLNKKMGISNIDAAENAALLNAGFTAATPRYQEIAARVTGLEYLFFNDLFLRRAIQKVNGAPEFTPVFEKMIDNYFDLFRPVKTYHVFIPFVKPLYYTPYNYPLVNNTKVIPIYEDTDAFTLDDLFSATNQEKLGKFVTNLSKIDDYISDYNAANEINIQTKRDLMQSFYLKYSTIIDKLIESSVLDIEVEDLEKSFKGESYLTLSSNTFDQRLKSYSGSAVPSYTQQALVNTYFALDGLAYKNNALTISDQQCNSEAPNTNINQIINPVYGQNTTFLENADTFINHLRVNTIISGEQVKRLVNCFMVLPVSSRTLGDDLVLISVSNYGMHFSLPLNYLDELKTPSPNLRNLFKQNLLNDLLTCNLDDGQEIICDNARRSLVNAFGALKYYPLMLTDLFDNINVLDSNAAKYIADYEANIENSFENYGISAFIQSAEFISYEVSAGSYVPIEFNIRNFNSRERWG